MPAFRLGFRANEKTLSREVVTHPESLLIFLKTGMNDKKSNPHPQPKTLRAHKFNTTIQGRQLFFELPADFPLGEIEVIVLADENPMDGHDTLRQGQSLSLIHI